MQKYVAILALLGVLAALYAWAGPSTRTSTDAPTWEYKEITTTHQSLLRPATDSNGDFDKAQNDKETSGIAFANKVFDKQFQDDLQGAGRAGWELVSVTSTSSDLGNVKSADTTAYLKRRAR